MAKNALGYVKQGGDFEKKIYGVGTVKAGKNQVRVIVNDKNGDEIFNEKFGYDALPKLPKIVPESGEHEFNIVINPDKDGVEKLGPVEGHYFARLVDFPTMEEGADPEPTLIEKKDSSGKEYSYMQFLADFEIVKGQFKGVQVRHWLRYLFVENPDEPGYAGWKGDPSNPNAKHLPRLVDFCEKIGAINEPIEWPEDGNVLPTLLERGLRAGKIVDLTIKKGFISDILSADYEEDDEPKAKKSAPTKAKARPPLSEKDLDENLDDDL